MMKTFLNHGCSVTVVRTGTINHAPCTIGSMKKAIQGTVGKVVVVKVVVVVAIVIVIVAMLMVAVGEEQ
jgi:hypothetical protein